MRLAIILSLVCLPLLWATVAPANTPVPISPIARYETIDSIPEPLQSIFRPGLFIEEYIEAVLKNIRTRTEDRRSLTANDIDTLKKQTSRQAEVRQVTKTISYDMNWDGKVTREEVEEHFTTKQKPKIFHNYNDNAGQRTKNIDRVMMVDSDGDNIITYKEMSTISALSEEKVTNDRDFKNFIELLPLDPDKDGKLTAIELESMARRAFNTIDLDGDQEISENEFKAIKDIRKERNNDSGSKSASVTSETCQFEPAITLPADFAVYSAGAYSGKRVDNYKRIGTSGHPETEANIIINETKRPVALIIGTYEPTVWNVSVTPGTKIVAVVAGGYHPATVKGLDKDVPYILSSHEGRGKCGHFYFQKGKLEKLNPLSKKLFNKPVDMFYPLDDNGKAVLGEANYNESELITTTHQLQEPARKAQKARGEEPYDPRPILEKAVLEGILRKATDQDWDDWQTQMADHNKKTGTMDLPPTSGSDSYKDALKKPLGLQSYVVLKDFVYPDGMAGAKSASFYIAKGAKPPKGELGHSIEMDFNTMKCKGHRCMNYD